MADHPLLVLDHINLPANKPEWLADWYAENFGFKSKDGFVFGPGVLVVFERGSPVDYNGNTHFGFRSRSKEAVAEWALKLDATLTEGPNYCGFNTKDPEGNAFEIYWEE